MSSMPPPRRRRQRKYDKTFRSLPEGDQDAFLDFILEILAHLVRFPGSRNLPGQSGDRSPKTPKLPRKRR